MSRDGRVMVDRQVAGEGRFPLLARELAVQLHRARTWVALLIPAGTAVSLVVIVGVVRPGGLQPIGTGVSIRLGMSGMAMPLVALNVGRFFVFPLVVALLAGESLSSEASWGTLRYLLGQPISRQRVLAVKMLVALVLAVVALAVSSCAALGAGVALFGWHALVVAVSNARLSGGQQVYSVTGIASIGMIASGTAVVAASMASTFAFAGAVSTVTDQPAIAVGSGLGFLMVSRALANVPGFSWMVGLLPTAYGKEWAHISAPGSGMGDLWRLLGVQAAYVAVFAALAFRRFVKQDPVV